MKLGSVFEIDALSGSLPSGIEDEGVRKRGRGMRLLGNNQDLVETRMLADTLPPSSGAYQLTQDNVIE